MWKICPGSAFQAFYGWVESQVLDFVKHSHVGKPADMPFVHLAAAANHIAVIFDFSHDSVLLCKKNKSVAY